MFEAHRNAGWICVHERSVLVQSHQNEKRRRADDQNNSKLQQGVGELGHVIIVELDSVYSVDGRNVLFFLMFYFAVHTEPN